MREDWEDCALGHLSTFEIGGDWGKEPSFNHKDYINAFCIRGSEFRNWKQEKGKTASARKIKKTSVDKRNLKENDILVEISGGGPDQPVGRTVVIDKFVLNNFYGKKLVCTNFLRIIRPSNKLNSFFIDHYLHYFYHSGEIIKYQGGSNNLRNLKFTDFLTIKIPIAPLPIQRAIVLKIENLFSSLDKGIADLKKAQEQLKVYRHAVLRKAFDGGFTQKEVKNGILPFGWQIVQLNRIADSLDHLRRPVSKQARAERIGKIPYYGANGRTGWIDDYLFDETLILVVEDETFTGRELPFSYKITGKSWVNNHAHILRPKETINIDFLNYQLFYYPFLPLTTGTTGRKKLTKNALMNAYFKICPLIEQKEIVKEIESRMSVCEKIEQSIVESIRRAETLRQSILRKAFEGKLLTDVEVDKCRLEPDYEPASELLKKIKADKK